MENQDFVRILAISGSLRRASSNSALVAAIARLAPLTVDVSIYRELDALPPFNPDLDGDDVPAAVSNTSGRATHAWASLAETLAVMSALVIPEASITVSLQGTTLDANGIIRNAELATALRSAIEALAFAARRAHGA